MINVEVFINSYTKTPDGTIAPNIPGQQSLSGFNIGSNGKLLYTVFGEPVTALIGTLDANGSTRTLTHESSGVATISGAPITSADVPIAVTVTSTAPRLSTPVVAANVVNNVPAPPPLTKRAINFESPATKTGDAYGLAATQAGFLVTETVNSVNAFEIVYRALTDGNVLVLDDKRTTSSVWPPVAGTRKAGVYANAPNVLAVSETNDSEQVGVLAAVGRYYKLAKAGSDVTLRASTDGITYSAPLKTWANAATAAVYHARVINAIGVVSSGEISFYS